MTSLRTNVAAMTALSTLKLLGRDLDSVGMRVATGLRVAEASDSAAYWSIATGVRTENAVLSAVRDSLDLGAGAVDTAYGGLNAVLSDLQGLRAKLQTALQPGVDRAKVQAEIASIQARMRATALSSVAGGENWLAIDSAALDSATRSVAAGSSRAGGTTGRIAIAVADVALYDAAPRRVAVPGTGAKVTAEQALPDVTDFSTGAVQFALGLDGAPARTVVLDAAHLASAVPDLSAVTPSQIVRAINNAIGADPLLASAVRAGLDTGGRLTFETTATGGARSLVVDRTSTSTAANLVTNGGFENDLAGWTWSGGNIMASASPHSGSSNLKMGTVNALGEIQTPVSTNAGQSYDLTFWLANDSGLPNHFEVYWDTTLVYAADNLTSATPYKPHTVTVTASGPVSLLTFKAQHNPAFWRVDDVSVTAVGATPAPTLGFGSGAVSTARGYGSDAATSVSRGLLDTVDAATGVSIETIDIAGLSGTGGDSTLRAIVTQVEAAIARLTSGGATLGAARTQIAGQRSFIDTLMKVNARTIGILVDADVEADATRLKALQTQQQLAAQSLSIANASSGTLLSLFR